MVRPRARPDFPRSWIVRRRSRSIRPGSRPLFPRSRPNSAPFPFVLPLSRIVFPRSRSGSPGSRIAGKHPRMPGARPRDIFRPPVRDLNWIC